MKPPIKDTPKEDKPPNKGQAERKSPLKEDNLSTKDKMAGPECILIIIHLSVESGFVAGVVTAPWSPEGR